MKKELLKKSIIIMGVVVLCFAIPFGASAYNPQGAISVFYSSTSASSLHTFANINTIQHPNFYSIYDNLTNYPDFIPLQYVEVYFNEESSNSVLISVRFDTALFYYAEEFRFSIVVPSTSGEPTVLPGVTGVTVEKRLLNPRAINGMYFYECEIYGTVPSNLESFAPNFYISVSDFIKAYGGIVLPISYLNVTYSEDFSNAGYLASIADSNNNISQSIGGIYSSLTALINQQAMADPDFVAGLDSLRQDILQDYNSLDQAVTDFENNFNDDNIYDAFYGSLEDLTRSELPAYLSLFYTEFMGGSWFWIEIASIFGGLALFSKVVFG